MEHIQALFTKMNLLRSLPILIIFSLASCTSVKKSKLDPEDGKEANRSGKPKHLDIELLLREAEQGNANSADLASSYYFLVKQNGELGCYWRLKAAQLGDPMAQFNQGQHQYLDGKTEEERAEGVRWLKKAAAQGEENAIKMLKDL